MTTHDGGLKRAFGASFLLSILLIIFGIFALLLPAVVSNRVVMVIGWLVIFDGITQFAHVFHSTNVGHTVWKLIVAVLYVATGTYLLTHPALGVAGLALALGMFLFAEGGADVIAYFSTRNSGASPWMLADGIITLSLGLMIWSRWPFNSPWVIGTLVGLSMLMAGTTRLMMGLAFRKLASDSTVVSSEERAA
jgi:uncharacterized membrane protein HdeD (DUF308 family)